ncbi:MAG: DUF5518 domain-containing protein [Halobacteriota archaeon]|uniref:DUF5518 domain-containing protein n=1 Tax=Natronomonas sp. TaxID=2184060 RepID=UPI0039771533
MTTDVPPDDQADGADHRAETHGERLDGSGEHTEASGGSSLLMNALVGAIVTVVTTPIVPFAPVLGGAIAGYLDADRAESGAKIGAISGVIALVPLLVIVPFLLFVVFLEPVFAVGVLAVVAFVGAFLFVYTIGLGALGGVLGVYIRREFVE